MANCLQSLQEEFLETRTSCWHRMVHLHSQPIQIGRVWRQKQRVLLVASSLKEPNHKKHFISISLINICQGGSADLNHCVFCLIYLISKSGLWASYRLISPAERKLITGWNFTIPSVTWSAPEKYHLGDMLLSAHWDSTDIQLKTQLPKCHY